LTGCRLVIDTGDAIGALAEAMGRSPGWGASSPGRWSGSRSPPRTRSSCGGSAHREWLAPRGIRATVIPDGVDLAQFRPLDVRDLRARLGLNDRLTIGVLGSVVWNRKTGSCYGWELVELIGRLRDHPVAGILIGDGSGLEPLRRHARALGIEHRILFFGRRPYEELPRLINLIDVCLSTQTDDLPGRVRTTGKLPLYLACGRHVLASRVGEAARVLPEEMLVLMRGPSIRTIRPASPVAFESSWTIPGAGSSAGSASRSPPGTSTITCYPPASRDCSASKYACGSPLLDPMSRGGPGADIPRHGTLALVDRVARHPPRDRSRGILRTPWRVGWSTAGGCPYHRQPIGGRLEA
jgi:hypothetical protein